MIISKYFTCLIAFIFFIAVHCRGQQDSLPITRYGIDASMEKEIAKKDFSGMTGAYMDITWLNDQKEVPIVSGKKHPAYAVYTLQGDTISIILMPLFSPGTGIAISLFRDSAMLYHFASPKGPGYIFKHTPEDKEYVSSIQVKGATKLILTTLPVPGEPVKGYFEFSSDLFYEKDGTGTDTKRSYNAQGYFRAMQIK